MIPCIFALHKGLSAAFADPCEDFRAKTLFLFRTRFSGKNLKKEQKKP
jgi:hypothetical protein